MKKLFCMLMTVAVVFGSAGCAGRSRDGSVSTDGSTSMEALIGALGEAFETAHTDVTFTYNPTGSGSGIRAVEEGRCDIGLSSRNLTAEEQAAGLIGTVFAYDGIVVVVHPDNPVSDLTRSQIADIYTGEITDWSAVGGNSAAIVPIGREAGSGTRDGFETATDTKDRCVYRQELISTGDVMTTVAGNPQAIGYASLASVNDRVKVLAVEGVLPAETSIQNGSYTMQQPFLLVTKTNTVLSVAAQTFFNEVTSDGAAEIITAMGFVPAHGEEE